jgi:hypothetical protein
VLYIIEYTSSVGANTVKGPGPFKVLTRFAAVNAVAKVLKLPIFLLLI